MPPKGSRSSPELSLENLHLEEPQPFTTTIGEVPDEAILKMLKSLNLKSAVSAVSASPIFGRVLKPEDHPEYVSFIRQLDIRQLEGTRNLSILNRILPTRSLYYLPQKQRLAYLMNESLYILNNPSGEVKIHKLVDGNDSHDVAFNHDGSIIVLRNSFGFITIYKYNSTTNEIKHLKTRTEPNYYDAAYLKTTVIDNRIYILCITNNNKFNIYSTNMDEQSPFQTVYETLYDSNCFHLDVSQNKVLVMSSSGCKGYLIEPTGNVVALGQIYKPIGNIIYPSSAVFHPNGNQYIVLSTSVSGISKIELWNWTEENRIEKEPVSFNDVDRRLENNIAFSPNGRYVAIISLNKVRNSSSSYQNPKVELWEVASGKHIRTVELITPNHKIKKIYTLGFYKDTNGKQWVFVVDGDLKQYAFKPELVFFGGARKTRSSKK